MDHDSYVELSALFKHSESRLRLAMVRPDNPLGRLSSSVAHALALAASKADTLTDEQQDIIWANLSRL